MGGYDKYSGEDLWSWLLEVEGGIDVKFWTFDGRERVTKIEQVRTREEFCSFGDSEIIECPLHEMAFTIKKIKRIMQASASARAMKFTNYLYLHKEQLLEAS